jgi:hypothetical protein
VIVNCFKDDSWKCECEEVACSGDGDVEHAEAFGDVWGMFAACPGLDQVGGAIVVGEDDENGVCCCGPGLLLQGTAGSSGRPSHWT